MKESGWEKKWVGRRWGRRGRRGEERGRGEDRYQQYSFILIDKQYASNRVWSNRIKLMTSVC